MTKLGEDIDRCRLPDAEQNDQDAGPTTGRRLRALVLLSGSVRSTPLSAGIERSLLDLPLNDKQTVLDHWHQQIEAMALRLDVAKLPVRVMINRNAEPPSVAGMNGRVTIQVEEDASTYRGTAGVLHDVAMDYDDDDLILVANGAQLVLEPLDELFMALARSQADISIVSHDDGTPSSFMLVRCSALRSIADVGFVDMKEQALPRIAEQHRVTVVHRSQPVGLPLRNLTDYTHMLLRHHRERTGRTYADDAFAEHWQATFKLIETGAQVDPSVRVHDSVVLAGARVERGAVLVQSVVCRGAVVRRNQTITDRLIASNGRPS